MHVPATSDLLEVLGAVIENGTDADAFDKRRYTDLHAAVITNPARAVDVLTDAGADTEASKHRINSPAVHLFNMLAPMAALKSCCPVDATRGDAGRLATSE